MSEKRYRVERVSFTTERAYDTPPASWRDASSFTDISPENVEAVLNQIAAEGWRLVFVERVEVRAAEGERLCIFERVDGAR